MIQNLSGASRRLIGSLLPMCCALMFSSVPSLGYDRLQFETLQKGVEEWNRFRAESGQEPVDLSEAALKGKNLNGVNFQGAVLRGADFESSNLSNACFDGADLTGARLFQTCAAGASFRDALCKDALMEEALCSDADFRNALLDGSVIKQADFSESILNGASLRDVDLRSTDLRHADLSNADLSGAYLWKADISFAGFDNTVISNRTVVESGSNGTPQWAEKHHARYVHEEPAVSFQELSIDRSRTLLDKELPVNTVAQKIMFGQRLDKADELSYDVFQFKLLKKNISGWNSMRQAQSETPIRLSSADLSRKVLDSADLHDADLSRALLKGTDLVDADLRGADLSGCNLRQADLTHADLSGADLRGAYLWRANCSWTVFANAIVDASTILDTGRHATAGWAEINGAVYRESN